MVFQRKPRSLGETVHTRTLTLRATNELGCENPSAGSKFSLFPGLEFALSHVRSIARTLGHTKPLQCPAENVLDPFSHAQSAWTHFCDVPGTARRARRTTSEECIDAKSCMAGRSEKTRSPKSARQAPNSPGNQAQSTSPLGHRQNVSHRLCTGQHSPMVAHTRNTRNSRPACSERIV